MWTGGKEEREREGERVRVKQLWFNFKFFRTCYMLKTEEKLQIHKSKYSNEAKM